MAVPVIVQLNSQGCFFTCYDFVRPAPQDDAAESARLKDVFQTAINKLVEYFDRIPAAHLQSIGGAKIFVVASLPGGRRNGGGFFRSAPDDIEDWRGRSAVTGVDDIYLTRAKHPHGLIAITDVTFQEGVSSYRYTCLHELAHMLDHKNEFSSGLTLAELNGVRYGRFNSRDEYVMTRSVGEMFAEAYSRWIINPNSICRDEKRLSAERVLPRTIPPGENQSSCSARLRRVLERL